jgi:glutathione S-transferase
MFAALNSIKPRIQNLAAIDLFHANEEWAKTRRPEEFKFAQRRLTALSDWLDGRDYLDGRFTVADLLMTTVLRIPRDTDRANAGASRLPATLRNAARIQESVGPSDSRLCRRSAGDSCLNYRVGTGFSPR